jgi:6-pyruvoyltetrahydropterin/6-carboxytetrahydropterin synthase
MFTVSKRFSFSASHVLHGLAEGHPCARLHGHNYEVEVIAAADELDDRGFVVDFGELDLVKDWVDATLDHRHLNDVMEGQPSAEAIAKLICEWARSSLPPAVGDKVVAVRAWETPKAYAEYRPGP